MEGWKDGDTEGLARKMNQWSKRGFHMSSFL
jgi:hypothetical protein